MSSKRGQIAVFIIIGIVIVVVIGLFFFLRGERAEVKVSEEISIDTSSLNAFIRTCAQQTAQDAVVYTGLRGGVSNAVDFVYFSGIPIPEYFSEGADKSPSIDTVKSTLEYYMNNALKQCTEGFESFIQQGYEIEEGTVNSSVTIAEEDVIFSIAYPVTLIKDGSRETKSDFNANVKARIPLMLGTANDYIENQKEKPNSFRLGSLMHVAEENNIKFESIDRGEGNVIISFIDEDTIINGNPFVWSFAVKYDWTSAE